MLQVKSSQKLVHLNEQIYLFIYLFICGGMHLKDKTQSFMLLKELFNNRQSMIFLFDKTARFE